jgi:glutamine synthetase
VLDWARDHGASVYCHWFQPLGGSGVRHGMTAGVQIAMVDFCADGTPKWSFQGRNLLFGETDGSSYMNGGLRSTHAAGSYLVIDATSPIFLRDDTIFIPACLTSYTGLALDEKLPLLKAADALSREGVRLLALLGHKTDRVIANIGLEQELFFVDRGAYRKRPDLQMCGRTVLGKDPPRGQEMSDHYMAPPSLASRPIQAMKEFQRQCFTMGIPMKTRHREVAPNQYEFAPNYGTMTTQIDQNLMAMQILDEVAAAHGLAALLQEKPFARVNGSGKHVNWSLAMGDGTNLLNVPQLASVTGDHEVFPVIMAAILKAINDNGDLMRLAIATPGNDFRLGACEAPPSIISTHLGEDMASYLRAYIDGCRDPYVPKLNTLDLKCSVLPNVTVPAEDRNRTSPFPYGGHRFEFRAVGSSQNVSLVNTVLATICAKAFKDFSDAIEGGAAARDVATGALKDSFRVIFNGNGYDLANQAMLTERGLWRIDSGVEAMLRFKEKKNVDLFQTMGVFTPLECEARCKILLGHYVGIVEIEANCLVDMINQHIIPACYNSWPAADAENKLRIAELQGAVFNIQEHMHEIHSITADSELTALETRARLARTLRLATMVTIREICDSVEALVPADKWTLATYKELLFLDMH